MFEDHPRVPDIRTYGDWLRRYEALLAELEETPPSAAEISLVPEDANTIQRTTSATWRAEGQRDDPDPSHDDYRHDHTPEH